MSRIIVVSNRVPSEDQGMASMGGLTMGLADALKDCGGLWFGWSGRTVATFDPLPTLKTINGVTIATLDLEADDISEYYNGYANTVLWPLFHHRLDLTHYERGFGDGYHRVNAHFAEAIAALIEPDDVIWVHDYHLIPLGEALRERGVNNPIGFFLHIPWPARELMTTLPSHQQLVSSLFAYDLVGFQCEDWLAAFKDYVATEAGGETFNSQVKGFGRQIQVGVFPIGIDGEGFRRLAASPDAGVSYMRAAASGMFRSMVIGVDRVDYAKGLQERFQAFERLLDDYPDLIQKVYLLQIGQPSRGEVEAYNDIGRTLDELSARINGKFTSVDWTPIRYLKQSFGRDHIAGFYRAARVGLVTPLRDGMNLVAKEYVAAQDGDDPGVLILSRFAGAARQMPEALIVNPYSGEDVADAINTALKMPLEERKARWVALMRGVQDQDALSWREAFLQRLHAVRKGSVPRLDLPAAPSPARPRPTGESQGMSLNV